MTTAIPFSIISVSNVSIIRAIYKNRRLFEEINRGEYKRSVKFRRIPIRRTNRSYETSNSNIPESSENNNKSDISTEFSLAGAYKKKITY